MTPRPESITFQNPLLGKNRITIVQRKKAEPITKKDPLSIVKSVFVVIA